MERHRSPAGITLVEVVVILLIAIAVSVLLMLKVTSSRESSRRMECEENLRVISAALQSYSLVSGYLPIGTQNPTAPIESLPNGYHHNWAEALLPMLDQQETFDQIHFDSSVYAPINAPVAELSLQNFRCSASANKLTINATTYTGVVGSQAAPIDENTDGMFSLNRWRSLRDAEDGQSFVLSIAEKSVDFPGPTNWNSGTRASLRNAGHPINRSFVERPPEVTDVGGFSSNHIGGAYLAFVDGSFRFFSEATDQQLLQDLASRKDAAAAAESSDANQE
ncbi:DUF1559 domain-containing protein [Stieleria sp. JC731]|uniref:DUF1559 family PulG-like putative transporter n=1 Tax=Pirellulaceae TaxID=2691357 RepID=UPI001E609D06|nr:DUF1559 domain-containing protein [Stieleria sp. JC731]MCC9604187.1 DUF1559 domain-containing protein [Stieleria sp. JC731]